jgi:hypothetical protein
MAAPQPPLTPTKFLGDDGFPDDLVLLILGRIPCKDDRGNMSLVCKAWHDRIDRLIKTKPVPPTPPTLPWLVLPAPNSDGSFRFVCILSGSRAHHEHRFSSNIPLGARCFGSYDGGWLFLAFRDRHDYQLLDIRSGDIHSVPGKMLIPDHPQHRHPIRMIIESATLSASPDEENCAAVFVVRAPVPPNYRYLATWQKGWRCAVAIRSPDGFFIPDDVLYHDESFHVLRGDADVLMYKPDSEDWEKRRFFHPGGLDEQARSQYLVPSRGGLLLVVRFSPSPDQPTSMFKVFRATTRPQTPDDADFPVAEFPWAWSEMDTLDGRILFVGYGCSRSYDADQYPGIEAGIYFFDDGESNDEGVFFRDHNVTPYPCSDNGKYSGGHVQSCFPTTDPSDYSPPAWLLP